MHVLVPRFILQKFAAGERHGRFRAVVLFVDISGFTAVTEALMQHGKAGAEALADMMQTLFEPLIVTVYANGGFVAGFAGDAFTAVFSGRRPASAARAVQTAWQMQQQMAQRPALSTPFGDFSFKVKAGIDAGSVTWGIVGGESGQHVCYFRGRAVEGCAAAEHLARGGEVVMTTAVYRVVQSALAVVPLPGGDPLRMTAVTTPLPVGRPRRRDRQAPDVASAAAFHPVELLQTAVRGEFRQVTTIFLNLQQPSANALDDFMRHFFRLLQRYNGTLCRLDFGDKGCNLLLFWGAPAGHENDVTRALNFTLDLQARSALALRAGITSRLAFAGFAGAPLREEYTCYGLGVNQAARQMMAAPWGALWLDEASARRAGTQFDVTLVGRAPFKGFSEAQAVFRLNGRREAAAPLYHGQLVGREEELAALAAAMEPLVNGRFGGVVLITGEAGIGKSRLVHDFLSSQQSALNPQHFFCQSDEILRQPLNPFRYWLRRYFDQALAQPEAANKAAFDAKLDGLLAQMVNDDARSELQRIRSFLGALVDLYWDDSLYAQLQPELRFENTLSALKALVKAESAQRPVILQIEDVQWLDAESIHFLQRLARNVDGYPFLVMATSRDAEMVVKLGLETPPQQIELRALPETAVRRLVEAQLGGPISDALARALNARADGNPFFAEQMALYLRERGALAPTAQGYTAATPETALPLDVQTILVARLDRLTQAVKRVVQTAAVLGREFEVRVLSQMLRDEINVDARVQTAVEAAIWSPLSELRYLFRHVLLRDAAYEMQLQTRLAGLHRLAAAAILQLFAADLTPYYADLAFHYRRAGERREEKRYAQLAGERLLGQYANEEAIRYLSRALQLAESDAEKVALLLVREKAFDRTAQRTEQEVDLRQLAQHLATTADFEQRVYLLERLSDYYRKVGQYDRAKSYAQQLIDLGEANGEAVTQANGRHLYGWTLQIQGHYKESQQPLQGALNLLSPQKEPSLYGDVLQTLAITHANLGELDVAAQMAAESKALFQQLGDRFKLVNSINTAGLAAMRRSQFREGQAHFLEALQITREIGARGTEAMILSNVGVSHYYLSEKDEAKQLFVEALRVRQEMNDRWGEAMSLNNLGVILMDEGDLVGAVAHYRRCLVVCDQIGDLGNKVLALNNLGIVLLKIGDYVNADNILQEAIQVAAQSGDRLHEANARGTYAYLFCFTGQYEAAITFGEQAVAVLAEIGERVTRLYATIPIGHALMALGRLGEAEATYRETFTALLDVEKATALIPHSGLVEVLMRRGKPFAEEALALYTELDGKQPPITTNEPLYPYLVCYQALRQLNDARAVQILQQAYMHVQALAAMIGDADFRRLFLQEVSVHREIVSLYEGLPSRDSSSSTTD